MSPATLWTASLLRDPYRRIGAHEGWAPSGRSCMHKSLLDVVAECRALDELTVLDDVVLLDVGEETTTLTNEHEQTTTGVEVLLVGLHVLGQLLDTLGQDGDLNLELPVSRAFLPNLAVSSALRSLEIVIDFTFLVAPAGGAPMVDSPSTGKPPVERTSKVEVPTGRYVTTSSPLPAHHHRPT